MLWKAVLRFFATWLETLSNQKCRVKTVETAFPGQKEVWECWWESKARSFLFREGLCIYKCLLNCGPSLGSWIASCFSTGSIVWWWGRGPGGILCVCLLTDSSQLSPTSLWSFSPAADLQHRFCCSSAEQLPAVLAHLSAPTWANRFPVARMEEVVRCVYAAASCEICWRAGFR